MALKTPEHPEASLKASAPVPRTTVLELALYSLYTWQGDTYEKGKPYRFKDADAMLLLSEQDLGRQVWRIYRPPPKKETRTAEQDVVDATLVKVPEPEGAMSFGRAVTNKAKGRIDIGDDSEIQDILGQDGDETDNVTV